MTSMCRCARSSSFVVARSEDRIENDAKESYVPATSHPWQHGCKISHSSTSQDFLFPYDILTINSALVTINMLPCSPGMCLSTRAHICKQDATPHARTPYRRDLVTNGTHPSIAIDARANHYGYTTATDAPGCNGVMRWGLFAPESLSLPLPYCPPETCLLAARFEA